MSASAHATRRRFLLTTALAATGLRLSVNGADAAPELKPTPACHDHDPPTMSEEEGPYFKPSSPERADLIEPAMKGVPVELTGVVLGRTCRPLAGALVDIWHADDDGQYDNKGFRLRGHQFTDEEGRFRFRTIKPGLYPGRTRHYHVKVQAKGSGLLTTQLYFVDEPRNRQDGLFNKNLLMRLAQAGDSLSARFDFVLDMR
jgi:protocatechuate 3,4-dioxygenase beta subunit